TVEDSMSMVHLSSGINAPASGELLSEPAIVARLAEATLGERSRMPWRGLVADYDRIRDLIAAVFDDLHDFNQRVRVPGGSRRPPPHPRRHRGGLRRLPRLHPAPARARRLPPAQQRRRTTMEDRQRPRTRPRPPRAHRPADPPRPRGAGPAGVHAVDRALARP